MNNANNFTKDLSNAPPVAASPSGESITDTAKRHVKSLRDWVEGLLPRTTTTPPTTGGGRKKQRKKKKTTKKMKRKNKKTKRKN